MPSFSFTVLSPTASAAQTVAGTTSTAPRNFKLTTDNDFDLSTGNLQMLSGIESIAQDIRLALQFFMGEWFLDRSVGVPYFQEVLVKTPDPNALQSIFRKIILGRPGVVSLLDIQLAQDDETRKLNLAFRVQTDAGVLDVRQGF